MSTFKYLFLFLCVFLMRENLRAEENLRSFATAVMTSMPTDFNKNSVRGWEVEKDGEEVVVRVYATDGTALEYHCEDANHCHQASKTPTDTSFPQDTSITLDWITKGQNVSFEKLENTLQKKSLNLGTLNSYSVWVHEDTGHGHDHGTNIWTAMEYEKTTVYVMCHGHAGEDGLFCHYRKSPEGGLGEHEEEHDDHDDHEHDHDEHEEEHDDHDDHEHDHDEHEGHGH